MTAAGPHRCEHRCEIMFSVKNKFTQVWNNNSTQVNYIYIKVKFSYNVPLKNSDVNQIIFVVFATATLLQF